MENFQLLILLFIYNYLGIVLVISVGIFFFKLLKINYKSILSYSELGFFGFIFIGFFSIFLNFFVSINPYVTSFFSLLFIFFSIKEFIVREHIKIFYISLFAILLLFASNNNSPDAGLYHLPYIQVLNENKIIIGLSNIHFRFGLASIWQYIAAFYNNFLFEKNGITIPLAILPPLFFIFLIEKIYEELKGKDGLQFAKIIFLFFLLISSLYSFSRYSNYANDAPSHIYYFYLIYLILNSKNYQSDLCLTLISFVCLFLFSNKLFFILVFFIPLYFLIKLKLFLFLKSKIFVFLIIIFFLILLKNLLISGCLLYPVPFTCFNEFAWLNYKEVINQANEGEAWAKGWSNQNTINSFQIYSSKFNWLSSWYNVHFKIIIEKFLPIILFCLLVLLMMIFNSKKKTTDYIDQNIENFNLIFLLSFLNFIFWFTKFPLYRYGYSFLLIFWLCLFLKFILTFNISFNYSSLKKLIKYSLIMALIFITAKNLNRIGDNFHYKYENYPWPNIVSFDKNQKKPSVKKILLTENFIYETDGLCMYYKAPCTNYKDKKIDSYNYYFYKVYINK